MYKLIFDKFPDLEFEIDSICNNLLKQHILPTKMLITHEYSYVLYVINNWLEDLAKHNIMSGSFKIVSESDSFTVNLYNGYPMSDGILLSRDGTKHYLAIVPHRDFSIDDKIVNERFSKIIENCLENNYLA
jgi:hypothetical protein